ncbi:MAG: DNA-directed RNA polymerase subunit omega [Kiritimatiellae bacterium]|jgi:DNA-directed RNA polymerase subunit K/omega|nr:DNA-directed RNA polymerase subunit omega [Kiritimatiellia bacterium]
MNAELLKRAHEKIPSVPVLVNLVSKRERDLINGAKPLLNPTTLLTPEDRAKGRLGLDVDKVDIALAEVAEGKLIAEIDFDAIARAEGAKTKWNQKHMSVNSLFAD